jgi:hypothetical protein
VLAASGLGTVDSPFILESAFFAPGFRVGAVLATGRFELPTCDDYLIAHNAAILTAHNAIAMRLPLCASALGRDRKAGAVVGTGRFELPTCRLGGGRSIHLSYVPTIRVPPIRPQSDCSKQSRSDRFAVRPWLCQSMALMTASVNCSVVALPPTSPVVLVLLA